MEIWQKNAFANIAELFSKSELSQAAFARKVKVNGNHLNMVMNAKRPVTRNLVASIADAFGVDRDWFYADHSAKPEPALGLEMIKAAVREALAEGPLPQRFEIQSEVEQLRARVAELEAELQNLKSQTKARWNSSR